MMKLRVLFVAFAVLVLGASSAHAQRFGAQLDYGTDTDLGVGARLEYDFGGSLASSGPLSRAFLIGSFDYFFPDCGGSDDVDCSYWEVNANLATPITASSLRPYVGAGLNYANVKAEAFGIEASNSEVGLNVLGGLRFNLGGMSSFAEGRFEVGGGEQLVLTFGVLFGN